MRVFDGGGRRWGKTVQRYAELEIALRWMEQQGALDVDLRFVLSDQQTDDWKHFEPLTIDLKTLARYGNDADAYGAALTGMVFTRPDIAKFYATSRAAAQDRPIHLRLRLDAPHALHGVRWELLRDPQAGHPVTTTDGILFSRYLSNPDFRPVPWRTKQASRALVVISGPTDIDRYHPDGRQLAKVDIELERRCAEAALDGITTVYLAAPGEATLADIERELAKDVDILYLVCHGGITSDVPFVYLQHKDGTTHPVSGRRLAERIGSLARRPSLAVLNSCQSAGPGGAGITADDGVLAGLGPRLVGAGGATVIAMQGNVSMETARQFTARFFEELRGDGVVDRAATVARRSLRDDGRPDWWVPALFSRLRSGRTYFKAEFTENGDRRWAALRSAHHAGRFTPILGPGMTDELLGSRQAIAERWAEGWQMPLAAHNRDDLAKVTQFLRVELRRGEVLNKMDEYLKEEIAARVTKADHNDAFFGLDPADPKTALMGAGRFLLRDPGNAYRTVAAMPVPVFITTNWTTLLEQALRARTPPKNPTTVYFPWTKRTKWAKPPEPLDEPTVDEPLVYHLCGGLDDLVSLVLTEDDYFEWLTAWITKQKLVPDDVKMALMNRSLLFLGHRLDDWEFKIMFQAILSYEGSKNLPENEHVGVQLNPGSRLVEPEAAQKYLESYFGINSISVYWAETRKFLDEYRDRTGMAT
jgi:hypothetical protein